MNDIEKTSVGLYNQIQRIIQIIRYGKKEQRLILFGLIWIAVFYFIPKGIHGQFVEMIPDWFCWPGAIPILWAIVLIWKTAIPPKKEEYLPQPSAIKGASAFGEHDGELFSNLGRKSELEKILNHVLDDSSHVIIVMGESGAGKTSLLKAGLVYALNKRIEEFKTIPVYWEALPSNSVERLIKAISSVLGLDGESANLDGLSEISPQEKVCIILDQFEQLSPKNQPDFFKALSEHITVKKQKNITWIISFREEYAATWWKFTEQTEGFAPPPMIAIERFTIERAKRIFSFLAEKARLSPDAGVITDLIESVAVEDTVSPVEIGIGLDVLSENTKGEHGRITVEDYQNIGGSEGFLSEYIKKKLMLLPPESLGKLLTVFLALIDQEEPLQRIAEGREISDLAQTAEMDEKKLSAHLLFMASRKARLLEQLPPPPEKAKAYRLIHERLIPAIYKLTGSMLAEAEKAKLMLNKRYAAWVRNKRLRFLLSFGEYRTIRKHKKQLNLKVDEKDKQIFIHKSLKHLKIKFSSYIIILLAVLIGLNYLYNLKVDEDHRLTLKNWYIPPDLYDLQKRLDTMVVNNDNIQHIDWIKGNFNKLQISSNSIVEINDYAFPNSIVELYFNPGTVTSFSNIIWPESLTELNLNLFNTPIASLENMKWPENLTMLNLDLISSKIKSLENMKWPESLTELNLDLSSTPIKSLGNMKWPNRLEQLTLDISDSKIQDLSNIELPEKLKVLDITYFKLSGLPQLPPSVNTLRLER